MDDLGGDFGSILTRSIRRPHHSTQDSANHTNATTATTVETTIDNNATTTSQHNNLDWTPHHISYPRLMSTLSKFRHDRIQLFRQLQQNLNSSDSGLTVREYNEVVFGTVERDGFENVRALGRRTPGSTNPTIATTTTSTNDSNELMTTTMNNEASITTSYLSMETQSILTHAQLATRLSADERSILASLLDKEVERAVSFYRARVAELAPITRVEQEGLLCTATTMGFDCDVLRCGEENAIASATDTTNGVVVDKDDIILDKNDLETNQVTKSTNTQRPSHHVQRHSSLESNDLLAPTTTATPLTPTQLGHEILELHAFLTTNILVIRQILIHYDAYARSVNSAPMGSWYQTSRWKRGYGGRCSDYRDLVRHGRLRGLTKVYCKEVRRAEWSMGDLKNGSGGGGGGGGSASQFRWKVGKAFYKLVDGAEEMKKRQKRKWRQGVMDVEYEEEEGEDEASTMDDNIHGKDKKETSFLTASSIPSSWEYDTEYYDTPLHSSEDTTTAPPLSKEDIAYQIHIFKCIQSKTRRSIEKTYTGHISGWWDNAIATLRDFYTMGSASDNLSLMPEFLIMRGKSLRSCLLVVAKWRERRDNYSREGTTTTTSTDNDEQWFGGFCGEIRPDPKEVTSSTKKTSFKSKLALFMNILACFFYMMNYYIVEPSSTRYANALGMGDAMSGLIIGAMPWAAMTSAVLFSIWSNHNYRQPLLASGVLLLSGNLLYASAYRRGSITMALCGRFLTGLGGPRSMNRRYIADTTPLAYRTSVNAAFGTATAMGAALGPATAIMIDSVEIQFDVPLYGTVYFNGMTGPGFIMCGLWMLFTIVLALTFEEPERTGLEEQKRKEMEEARVSAMGGAPGVLEMSELSGSTKHGNIDVAGSDEFVAEQPPMTTVQGSATPYLDESFNCTGDNPGLCIGSDPFNDDEETGGTTNPKKDTICSQLMFVLSNLTIPVRLCMFLLFSKMFTVESVISAASMVTKNRYGWHVQQVGVLGTIVGCLTIPISIFIGWVSQYREDRVLMLYLMTFATVGMGLLVDVTDFVDTDTVYYNKGNPLAVGPHRYVAGYLLVFCSVQAFDGVVGSVLSKVIPTALATGTLNSGLLATVVGTFGRACGDVFITCVGFIDLRNVMNMLYIPAFFILLIDLILIWRNYDALTA